MAAFLRAFPQGSPPPCTSAASSSSTTAHHVTQRKERLPGLEPSEGQGSIHFPVTLNTQPGLRAQCMLSSSDPWHSRVVSRDWSPTTTLHEDHLPKSGSVLGTTKHRSLEMSSLPQALQAQPCCRRAPRRFQGLQRNNLYFRLVNESLNGGINYCLSKLNLSLPSRCIFFLFLINF
jgi:hypothetical protein